MHELRVRRWLLAGAGLFSTGLGAIGVFVPGLPTTVFLLIASICFARSCPWLERRLLRTRLFAPYMPWVDGKEPLPRRARISAIAAMWIAVTGSVTVLFLGGLLAPWTALLIPLSAVIGTVVIAGDVIGRMRRRAPRDAVCAVPEE
jgi:uncharacterized membrane protein YbaN (DUF454 family)